MNLGTVGIFTSYRRIGEENGPEAAQLAEELGFGTFWLGGSPSVDELRPLLAPTSRITVASGILNVWQHEPGQVASDWAQLSSEFPGRALLGIGIGHSEAIRDYSRPLSTMRAFFDGLDAAPTPVPRDERCVAALGPKMLDLSAERSLGTLPYFSPVEHTRFARERLGSGPLIAGEPAFVIDTDLERGRARAREYASSYLRLRNYTDNLLRFDFTEADLANDGSDRLIDAVVPVGSAEQIAEIARAHLAAGADHIALQPVGVDGIPREEWAALAAVML